MTQRAWCAIVAATALGAAAGSPASGAVAPGDGCSGAGVVVEFPYTMTVNLADFSTESGPGAPCDPSMPPPTLMSLDAWLKWTATHTGVVDIALDPAPFAAVVQVFSGLNCGALAPVACAANAGSVQLSINAVAGQTYWLQFGQQGNQMTAGSVSVSIKPRPVNDECMNAIELFEETPEVGNTALATSNAMDPSFACPLGGAGVGSLWYSFEAPAERVVITTIDTVFTTLPVTKSYGSFLAAYTGQCGSLTQIGCKGKSDYFPVGQSGSGHSTLDLEGLTVGQTYLVQVATPPARTRGALVIRMSVPPHCPIGSSLESENCAQMVNNSCNDFMPIALGATMCGTFWSYNGSSDIDIYLLKLAKPATVPVRLRSLLPMRCRVYQFGECLSGTPLADFTTLCQGLDCDSEASIALNTGWYQIVVQVSDTVLGFDVCETGRNDYLLSLGTPPNCDGDANGDNIVNFEDITEVIANWLRICP